MALPKKPKLTLDTNPQEIGTKYLKYGMDKIESLMDKTDVNTKYLPRTILLEDIDGALFDFVSDEGMKLVLDNKIVPAFYMDNDRWGEFSKTWKFMDDDKNVPTPYITVRRIDKQKGTRLGTKHRIPQPRKFRYMNVPILDEGQVIFIQFRMPEPVNVDMIYEVALFTKYRVDVNSYDEQVLKSFASHQGYIWINGSPMPLLFEGFAEANPIENIDGDRFFVSKYALKILGFIQDEKEFEIVKTIRKSRIGITIE